jgi:hypothetical protein
MNLNPDYVLAPFQQLLGYCQTNVLLGLRLVERIEKFPGPTEEELEFSQIQIQLGRHVPDISDSKRLFKQWILRNGFEEIHTSIRFALERLYVYKEFEVEVKGNTLVNTAELEKVLWMRANKFNFPNLIEHINFRLKEPLQYQRNIETINAARNCFVHRNGIVGLKDLNNDSKDKLTITGHRFKVFFNKDGKEVSAMLSKPGPENAALMLGAEEFTIDFGLSERIDISLKQFIDILNTCLFF